MFWAFGVAGAGFGRAESAVDLMEAVFPEARGRQGAKLAGARYGSQVNGDFGLTRRCDSLGAPNHLGTPDGQDKRLFG